MLRCSSQPRRRRRGASLAEYAIVLPVFCYLTFGSLVIGWGIFLNSEIESLAREGARWAAVHGGNWKSENNKTSLTTASDVYTNAILPRITKSDGTTWLDTSNLNYSVTWLNSAQMPTYTNGSGQTVANTVAVTVTYNWSPQLYLGAMTLSGSSVMTMVY
jgi:Flp pilus assembly protein TadG